MEVVLINDVKVEPVVIDKLSYEDTKVLGTPNLEKNSESNYIQVAQFIKLRSGRSPRLITYCAFKGTFQGFECILGSFFNAFVVVVCFCRYL